MADTTTVDDDPYITVETTAIAAITTVRIYDSTMEHAREGHPELELAGADANTLADAVQNPSSVHISTTAPQTSVVYVSNANTFEGHSLHVPVKVGAIAKFW